MAGALACGFGVSAGSDAEPVEAGADGAVTVGAPSWLAVCGATGAGAGFAGTGANAGATDSQPKEAGCGGASATASGPAGSEAPRAGAVMASGRDSKAPTSEDSVGRLSCVGGPALFDGLRVCAPLCSPTGPSVATPVSSRFDTSGVVFMAAKVTPIMAAPASASPPATSFQFRAMGVIAFRKTIGCPLSGELFGVV